MATREEKDRFNRRFGVLIACVSVGTWVVALLVSTVGDDPEAVTGTCIAPVFLLMAVFLFVSPHRDKEGEDRRIRRKWTLLAVVFLLLMELTSVVFLIV